MNWILAIIGLSAAGRGEDGPRRLSVVWRVAMPEYYVSSPVASPDGRAVAFMRGHTRGLVMGAGRQPLTSSELQTLKQDPWYRSWEVMVIEKGQPTPRHIGYGERPEFV